MVRRVRVLLPVLAVAAAVLGVAAPAHAAIIDGAQVGVTPNRYLTDGQTVHVTGIGFTIPPTYPDGWVVSECDAAVGKTALSLSDVGTNCDISLTGNAKVVPATAGGVVSTDFVVRKTFTTTLAPRPVTCGLAFDDCMIVIGTIANGTLVAAGAAIDFSAPPAITVTPNAHLHGRQTVTVRGTGFTATPLVNDWSVAQCTADILTAAIDLSNAIKYCDVTTEPFVFTHADAAGNLSSSFTVRRNFTTSGGIKARCGGRRTGVRSSSRRSPTGTSSVRPPRSTSRRPRRRRSPTACTTGGSATAAPTAPTSRASDPASAT
jgi:hypothetical protein